jgi:hypothetical protein
MTHAGPHFSTERPQGIGVRSLCLHRRRHRLRECPSFAEHVERGDSAQQWRQHRMAQPRLESV